MRVSAILRWRESTWSSLFVHVFATCTQVRWSVGRSPKKSCKFINTSMNSRVDGQLFGVSSRENPRDLLLLSVPPSQSSGNHPPLADRSAEAREPTLGARRAVPNTSAHLLCLVLWTGTEGTWRHTTGLFAWSSAGASP